MSVINKNFEKRIKKRFPNTDIKLPERFDSEVISDFIPEEVKGYSNIKIIGKGSFGQVWKAKSNKENTYYAIKYEKRNTAYPQVISEAKEYEKLAEGATDFLPIPKVYEYGNLEKYNYMVMQLLGQSLEDLKQHYTNLKDSTVLLLADQLIRAMEFVHNKGYVYRDVKPGNFLIGHGMEKSNVYIIDFGLARKYIDKNGKHIKKFSGGSLTGTPRFASINALKGKTQSRRDDMIALSYVFAYLLRGKLPWQGIAPDPKDKYKYLINSKMKVSSESLFEGHNKVFIKYHKIVSKLKYFEKPNYTELSEMMRRAANEYEKTGFEWALVIQKKIGDQLIQTTPRSSLILYQEMTAELEKTPLSQKGQPEKFEIKDEKGDKITVEKRNKIQIKLEELTEVIQFDEESYRLRRFSSNFADVKKLIFPKVWGWSECVEQEEIFPVFPEEAIRLFSQKI